MTTPIRTFDDILTNVKNQLNEILEQGDTHEISRIEFSIERLDVFTWLHNQKHIQTKLYWSSRNSNVEYGGLGVADKITDPKNLPQLIHGVLAHPQDLRYFGGMNFDTNQTPWETFDTFLFYLPRFEIVQKEDTCCFAINFNKNKTSIDELLTDLQSINFNNETHYRSIPIVLNRKDIPNRAEWNISVDSALDQIQDGDLKKIVLARKSIFDFDKPIDPVALLKHLKKRTPDCFHFCFQSQPYQGFIGASPERLFFTDYKTLKTEALAGTARRGDSDWDDSQRAVELLNSNKNTTEHHFVVDDVQKSIRQLCFNIHSDEHPTVFKVPEGLHLRTQFEGELREDILLEDILETIHPTPAVAGVPKKRATRRISQLEPFMRGWYAGPVGYIGKKESEFAVGIRSALVNRYKLSLFAGAGIVRDSTADNEWEEIETKITNFIRVFDEH